MQSHRPRRGGPFDLGQYFGNLSSTSDSYPGLLGQTATIRRGATSTDSTRVDCGLTLSMYSLNGNVLRTDHRGRSIYPNAVERVCSHWGKAEGGTCKTARTSVAQTAKVTRARPEKFGRNRRQWSSQIRARLPAMTAQEAFYHLQLALFDPKAGDTARHTEGKVVKHISRADVDSPLGD